MQQKKALIGSWWLILHSRPSFSSVSRIKRSCSCAFAWCHGYEGWRWVETMALKYDHQRAYCSSPRWYMSMENHGEMMMPPGENSWVVHQSSLAIPPAVWESWERELWISPYEVSLLHFEEFFNMPKNLTWDRRLYFPLEGRRAADF
jgi:hypothetical protein